MALNLLSAVVVHRDHGLINVTIVISLEAPILILLADELLGGLAKHALLGTMVVERVLIRSSLLCSCS